MEERSILIAEANRRQKLENDPVTQNILKIKMKGKSDAQIAKIIVKITNDTSWTSQKVWYRTKRCIELGIVTPKQIEEANQKEEKRALQKNEFVQKIIAYKEKQNLSDKAIARMPDIPWNQTTVSKYVQKCKKLGLIKEAKIKEAKKEMEKEREEKKIEWMKQDETIQKMIQYHENGLSSRNIAAMPDIPWHQTTVSKYLRKCRELNLIKKEEERKRETEPIIEEDSDKKELEMGTILEEKQEEATEENKIGKEGPLCSQKKKQTTISSQRKEVILKGYKQGLTIPEMIEKYPEQKLYQGIFPHYRSALIKEGKITPEEIKQARQERKKRKKEKKEEQAIKLKERQQRQKIDSLKREIDLEVRFHKKPSIEKRTIIREYIDTIYKIYKGREMPEDEFAFLKQAIQVIPITDEDIIKFVDICIRKEKYTEAFNMVKNRHQMEKEITPRNRKKHLARLEIMLSQTCKVQNAIEMIKRGNVLTEVISQTTGLSEDEVDFLKIKLAGKTQKFLSVSKREEIVARLLQDQDDKVIQKQLAISDFEMADIKKQVKFRKIPENKRDMQAQIKQDSIIRMVAFYTKLGKQPKEIAEILKKEEKEVQADKRKALDVGLLKANELDGIQLLNSLALKPQERQP